MEKLVSLSEVVKSYSDTKVLTGVNLDIEKGDLIVLLGPSGSGKTTLLNLIAGIDTANSGEIVVLGKDLSDMTDLELTDYRRDSVGYIFQFYNLLPNLTVMENASLGLELKGEFSKKSEKWMAPRSARNTCPISAFLCAIDPEYSKYLSEHQGTPKSEQYD